MTTLESLKLALRQAAAKTAFSPRNPLSETEYRDGFDILIRGSEWFTYQDFIIPQLSQLLEGLLISRTSISVLEIGPGPKSILGHLPSDLRCKVRRYAVFEPNRLFAATLETWLCFTSKEPRLPHLQSPPSIYQLPFLAKSHREIETAIDSPESEEKFDIVLFCHGMYGMKPQTSYIKRALERLVEKPDGGMVVVFHRDEVLHLDGLVCHQTASFPTGAVCVADSDEALDCFSAFVGGFTMQDTETRRVVQGEWRKACRSLGRRDEAHPARLFFSSPNFMVSFTKDATALPELTAQVPLLNSGETVKNREARLHRPAAIVRPTQIEQVQQCVRWALKHEVGLTVIGGGDSGHCLWPNVVSVDMGAFDQVHIFSAKDDGKESDLGPLIVAEAGCRTGDIVTKAIATGVVVPLGARPSVGAGLWLQGGIGHLARMYGLACDAIVGAVVVSVASSQILCIGCIPSEQQPRGAVRPGNEADLLWAIKGAGTNFGIVISVVFKAYVAPTYSTRNWIVPLSNKAEAQLKLGKFDKCVPSNIYRHCSADAYLYWDKHQLHLGVTMFESSTTGFSAPPSVSPPSLHAMRATLGQENSSNVMDTVGLFGAEMYMSRMHGGHGANKTSSFKRCLFLKEIGAPGVAEALVTTVETCPSQLCYLHLLQGGGAIGDVRPEASAFGCRDWQFACVVTGVWPCDQDESEAAQAAVRWVYQVARDLLPFSSGVYSADLGPDPRDAMLAAHAFGPNRPRLACLKRSLDMRNVLSYCCPLLKPPTKHRLIILVTGESCAGKDYCADIWVSVLSNQGLAAHAASISDAIKRKYAAASGSDLGRLLQDRAYKERHRSALTTFFQDQLRRRPRLPEEHFLNVVHDTPDVDVLLITGMRDEAPVAAFAHLVPYSRLLEVRIEAGNETRRGRRGRYGGDDDRDDYPDRSDESSDLTALEYCPNLIFENNTAGSEKVQRFAEQYLLPLLHEDIQRLANMVRSVPDFPRPGIEFRHVLNISQQPGGLALCASLLKTCFAGDWTRVDMVVTCEAGGFIYASALAQHVNVPLALVRDAGKLPPPTISVAKSTSHISSLGTNNPEGKMEIERDLIPRGASVVVVDDVLATGRTLCVILQLLHEAGICTADISIMVVAEFPVHRGRQLLRQRGFGGLNIQSLVVFDGA